MKKNVVLFTWEEKFLIQKELKKWKYAFAQKYSEENIFVFHKENFSYSNIINSIFSGGLFFQRRLVIVYWIPKDSSQENALIEDYYKPVEQKIIESIDNIGEETVLVLVSYSPDKRTKWYKKLAEKATLKTYTKLKSPQVKKQVTQFFDDKISDSVADYFVKTVWNDLFLLYNEASKVIDYANFHNTTIDKNVVDKVCFSNSEINAFDFLDNMLSNKQKSIKILDDLRKNNSDKLQFMGLLFWGLKSLLNIEDIYSQWYKSSKEIASKASLHPFVVSKNLQNISTIQQNKEKLVNLYKNILDIDFSIKTWKIPQEIVWLELKKLIYKF